MAPEHAQTWDALIVGAGPAGLSTAIALARQAQTTLVLDSQQYRNDCAARMHNVVTWDHQQPAEFRARGKDEILSRYDSVHFHNATVTKAVKTDVGFEVTDHTGDTYRGKVLILASGVTDIMLDIPGFADLWGKLVFHCLFCHGFEERGAESVGVLAVGPVNQPSLVLHLARMAKNLAQSVTVYCNGDDGIIAAMQDSLKGRPLTIEPRQITQLERIGDAHGSVRVHFADGATKEEAFLVSVPPTKINGPFVDDLGLETEPMGFIKTKAPFYETNVPGVFAVGDCGTMMKAIPQAIAMGSLSAAGVIARLGAEKI